LFTAKTVAFSLQSLQCQKKKKKGKKKHKPLKGICIWVTQSMR